MEWIGMGRDFISFYPDKTRAGHSFVSFSCLCTYLPQALVVEVVGVVVVQVALL